jgi:hypothetical protein
MLKENRTLQEVKRQQREQAVKEEQDINEKTKSYFPFTGQEAILRNRWLMNR